MSTAQQNPLFWIAANRIAHEFPDVGQALEEPNGLLAAGGDLGPHRLLDAYRKGIFPWYEEGQPILWWSPNPRIVFYPHAVKISRSLRRTLKKQQLEITLDKQFAAVIAACAAPRRDRSSTWITRRVSRAYTRLFEQGHAHSVEAWHAGRLVGGLYGLAIGRVFFGESMFSLETDASKVCLVWLCRRLCEWGYTLIDGQVQSEHLIRMGAFAMPRREFVAQLAVRCAERPSPDAWRIG